MKTGKIKFFNEAKGFGFIKLEGTDQEIFVHATGLVEKVKEDDEVLFELAEGKKGMNAVNVKKTVN